MPVVGLASPEEGDDGPAIGSPCGVANVGGKVFNKTLPEGEHGDRGLVRFRSALGMLNDNSLDLVEGDLIGTPVIELRCPG